MKHFLVLSISIILISCGPKVIDCRDGTLFIYEKCEAQVKYSGTTLEVGAIRIPEFYNLSVEGINLNQKVLNTASNIAQILDNQRLTYCETMNRMNCSASIEDQKEMYRLSTRVYELSIILNNEFASAEEFNKILTKWIAAGALDAQAAMEDSSRPLSSTKTDFDKIEDALIYSLEILGADPSDSTSISKLRNFSFM